MSFFLINIIKLFEVFISFDKNILTNFYFLFYKTRFLLFWKSQNQFIINFYADYSTWRHIIYFWSFQRYQKPWTWHIMLKYLRFWYILKKNLNLKKITNIREIWTIYSSKVTKFDLTQKICHVDFFYFYSLKHLEVSYNFFSTLLYNLRSSSIKLSLNFNKL